MKNLYYKLVMIETYIDERISKLEKTESEFGEHYLALKELQRLKEII